MDTEAIDAALAGEESGFAAAVKAVILGDLGTLRSLLAVDPHLVSKRSRSEHRATLIHYVAANGVEDALQLTPPNAVVVAEALLDAGADADARCRAYGDQDATTLSLLVSSCHPAAAGVQGELARLLCRRGALVNGPRDDGEPLATALRFGYPESVRVLVECGARIDNIEFAAAAGLVSQVKSEVEEGRRTGSWRSKFAPDSAPSPAREYALIIAAMCDQPACAAELLNAGADINAAPSFSHITWTALHTAAWQGHSEMVQFLLSQGADPTVRDERYQSTPHGWASHAGHTEVASILARAEANQTDLTQR